MPLTSKSPALFAKNVMTHLTRLGWTQGDLAHKSGITPSRISLYLNLQSTPSLEAVEKISTALDVSVADLFFDPEKPGLRTEADGSALARVMLVLQEVREKLDSIENDFTENSQLKAEIKNLRLVTTAARNAVVHNVPGRMPLTERELRLLEAFNESPPQIQICLLIIATGDPKFFDEALRLGLTDVELSALREMVSHNS